MGRLKSSNQGDSMLTQIKDFAFFSDLSSDDLTNLEKCLIEKQFKKGDLINLEGQECTRVFFVRAGRVKIYRTSTSGREQIFEILGAGDTCACNPGHTDWHCTSNAEALETTIVWFLSRNKYIEMVNKTPFTMHALNELFAKRLQCFGDIIEEVSLKDSKKRLVKFLLSMLDPNKKSAKNTLFINFTREEIAQRLGTARETVARHISELKRDKLIDVKPYRITILDRSALENLLK